MRLNNQPLRKASVATAKQTGIGYRTGTLILRGLARRGIHVQACDLYHAPSGRTLAMWEWALACQTANQDDPAGELEARINRGFLQPAPRPETALDVYGVAL